MRLFNRRTILAGLASTFSPMVIHARTRRVSQILVRACWQSFNMGEVAQVSGLLQFLQQELPEVRVTLWATNLDHGVGDWLKKCHPKVPLITGTIGRDGLPDQPALQRAWKAADFFLHGPAASVVARDHLEAWRKHTGKAYGVYGVSLPDMDAKLEGLLKASDFVWLRDGYSRREAARAGVNESDLGFGPDSAFSLTQRKSPAMDTWLKDQGLAAKPFVCVVPKLRFVPYWKIYGRDPKPGEIGQAEQNNRFQEADHQLLVDALIRCLRDEEMHVVICPAMPCEVETGTQWILEKLPAALRSRCLMRPDAWLPDAAAATFARAKCVLSLELLSSVVSIAAGTPALFVALPQDRKAGQMWRDVGLKEWIVDREDATGRDLAERMLAMMEDGPGNEARIAKASAFVADCQHRAGNLVRTKVGG